MRAAGGKVGARARWPPIVVAAVLSALAAQREIQAALRNIQPGIAQRLGQAAGIFLQQIQGLGLVGGHMRLGLAAGVNRKPHFDPAQFRRIKADVELLGAALRSWRRCPPPGCSHWRRRRRPGRDICTVALAGRRWRRCSAPAVPRLQRLGSAAALVAGAAGGGVCAAGLRLRRAGLRRLLALSAAAWAGEFGVAAASLAPVWLSPPCWRRGEILAGLRPGRRVSQLAAGVVGGGLRRQHPECRASRGG